MLKQFLFEQFENYLQFFIRFVNKNYTICTPLKGSSDVFKLDTLLSVAKNIFGRFNTECTGVEANGVPGIHRIVHCFSCHDLSIFYSEDGPLTNKWKTHPQNPIKINSLESRNAGIIFDKKKFIRVSQAQGFDNYGENINFHQIRSLTKKNYEEKLFRNKNYLRIKKKLNNANIHHYSSTKKNIIVDFK